MKTRNLFLGSAATMPEIWQRPGLCFAEDDPGAGAGGGGGGDPAGGNPAGGNPAGGNPATPGIPAVNPDANWYDGLNLSPENIDLIRNKALADPNAVINSYRQLEQQASSRIAIPGDDAKPEDWGKVYDRLGRPKDANAYTFAMPENLPKDFSYSKDLAEAMKPAMHEAGLNPKQAQILHDKFVGIQADTFNTSMQQREQAAQATDAALRKEPDWSGDKYDQNMTAITDMLTKFPDGNQILDYLEESGNGNNVPLLKLLHTVRQNFSDDQLAGGKGGGGAPAFDEKGALAEFQKTFGDAIYNPGDPKHAEAKKAFKELNEKGAQAAIAAR